MADSVIYHNPRCTTSRKTLELLRDNGIEPTVIQYLKTPPSRAELVKLIEDAGIDVRTAVRKREPLYAELNLADADDDATARRHGRASDPDRAAVRRDTQRHPAGQATRLRSRDSVTRHRIAATVVLAVIVLAGCGDKTPDYTTLLSTTTAPTTTSSPAPVPIAQYLETAGVTGQPIAPDKLTDLTVTMPRPKGWEQYSNPNFAPGTRVIAKGDTYPTAMLMVFQLTAATSIRPRPSSTAMPTPNCHRTSTAQRVHRQLRGFPSSMIEGSYDLNGSRMHSYNRIVIAAGSPPANQRYLIQFTVTGYADKAAEEAPDIEAIIAGFNVAKK